MLAYFHKYKNTATQRCQYTKMFVHNESYIFHEQRYKMGVETMNHIALLQTGTWLTP